MLSHLSTEFVRLPPESQKRVARQVIRDIKLNRISAHLFLLHIEWQNGIALCPDVALIWRGKGARIGHDWTAEEEAIIRAVYPAGAQIEIMAALPPAGVAEHSTARLYDWTPSQYLDSRSERYQLLPCHDQPS